MKFRTSHELEWSGNWETDCARFIDILNKTFDVLSEYSNSEYVRSSEDAKKQRILEARAREEMITGTFVETAFAECNSIYRELDEGEIVLDVAYGMMMGALQSGGHMVFRPEAVSDLRLILKDLSAVLEPMVNDSVGSEMHEEHLASLATAIRFEGWCRLAQERFNTMHSALNREGGE